MSVLVIFGSRTALEVAEAASLGYPDQFADILVRYFEEPEFSNSLAPALESKYKRVFYHAGVADVATKSKIVAACKARDWNPFSVIHPTAVVAATASIGSGSFIGPLAVVSSHAKLGEHVIVHIHASIGHDATVG
ncbi:MAG: hypothetical protein MUC83_00005, partial [Pirellula sp.]|nr:hypothetical protein [Pirellula sp.]